MGPLPSIVASLPDDITAYVVLDDSGGRLDPAWRETDEERTGWESVITDLIEGRYSNPARVVAFNTAEDWSLDVSREIAGELVLRMALDNGEAPTGLEGFFARHIESRPGRSAVARR